MNDQPLTGGVLDDEYAADIANFVSFLDDETPPLFVAGSLTTLLRTEPPVPFGPARVAGVVSEWAGGRSARTGERVSDLMLAAVRNIISAYGVNAVAHFRPKEFYRPFVAALMARCPEEQRDGLQAALRALQSGEPQRAVVLSTAEFQTGEDTMARLRASARSSGFADVLARLSSDPGMPDAEFDEDVALLRRAVRERGQVSVILPIENLLGIAIDVFNGHALDRAARLFEVAADYLDDQETPAIKRLEIKSSHSSHELDELLLVTSAADPARAGLIRPLVRCFADFAPDAVLNSLRAEKNPGRARFLLAVLELHGPAAHSAILDRLQAPAPGAKGGELVAALLDIVTRIPAPADATQRRATSVIGPLVAGRDPQVREAALRAAAHVDAEGAVPHLLKALEASSYGKLTAAEEEGLLPHLGAALDVLARSRNESTLAAVAEFASGARTGEFRLVKPLRELAAAALARHARPLPRRAALVVANALEEIAGKRLRFRIGSFALGGDPGAAAALLGLLEGSREPEALAALGNPALRKLAGK